VRREDGGDINMPLAAEWNGYSSLPFVEMADDCLDMVERTNFNFPNKKISLDLAVRNIDGPDPGFSQRIRLETR
jgi:hypothetical protein